MSKCAILLARFSEGRISITSRPSDKTATFRRSRVTFKGNRVLAGYWHDVIAAGWGNCERLRTSAAAYSFLPLDIGPMLSHSAFDPVTSWEAIQHVVEGWPQETLGAHGLHLIAASQWRSSGASVPQDFQDAERLRAISTPAAAMLLKRIRATVPGKIILLKGPELASYFPDPMLRPFVDIDILTPDAADTQARLLQAGFREGRDDLNFHDLHHHTPLRYPGLPLAVEIHSTPKWLSWMSPPSTSQLLDASVPSSTGLDGIETLDPAHHAMVVAAHAWSHAPLGHLLRLIDLQYISEGQDPEKLRRLAADWGLGGVWQTSQVAINAVFYEGPRGHGLTRRWIDQLARGHERSVSEQFLARALAPLWAPTLPAKITGLSAEMRSLILPEYLATWNQRAQRGYRALLHSRQSMSQYWQDRSK